MRAGRTVLLFSASFGIVTAILYVFFWLDLPRGAQSIEESIDYGKFSLVAAASFAGIISNALYDRVTSGKSAPLFQRTDIVFASVVAPMVVLPIYKSLSETVDPIILLLTAYQNGFFFNAIFEKLRKPAQKGQEI